MMDIEDLFEESEKLIEVEVDLAHDLMVIFKKQDGLCEVTEKQLHQHLYLDINKKFKNKNLNYSSGKKFYDFDEFGVFIELNLESKKNKLIIFSEEEIQNYAKSYRSLRKNFLQEILEGVNLDILNFDEEKKAILQLSMLPRFIKVFEFKPEKI